jgi:streptogramin lyase
MVPASDPTVGFFNPVTGLVSEVIVSSSSQSYRGGVLAPNGNVFFIPTTQPTNGSVGCFNPHNYTFSTVSMSGSTGFAGGCYAPTGKIIMAPQAASVIGIIDPVTLSYTAGAQVSPNPSAYAGYNGAVLLPSGNIVLVPESAATIAVYNPVTNMIVSNMAHGETSGAFGSVFSAGVLTPNGNVVLIPFGAQNITVFNPATNQIVSKTPHNQALPAFFSGVLTPTGNVIMGPQNSSNFGIFDPLTGAFSVLSCPETYTGVILIPDGRIVCIPGGGSPSNGGNMAAGIVNTMVPVDPAFCLSPYFNR